MTTNYRDQHNFPSSEEEKSSSSVSSSSSDESQAFLCVLSSPSSDYLVQSIVGEGVFGKVAKCVKTATKETVAVKIIKDSSFTPEVQCELTILEELRAFDSDRFNFVRYNDAFFDGQNICLEFEMLDKSLSDFLEERPSYSLSVKEIRPILHQMATALQLLRSQGIVHADLKLDNIMLVDHVNQPLKIKIIDFGWARYVSQTARGSYLQPRYYRSPEVIVGLPFTEAIDMWSLGCIAAELYLGHVLYPGSCEYDMLRHIVQTQGQLPQQLLNDGVKTRRFFQRNRCRRRQWRLMTPFEYGETTLTENYFNSLDDLENVRPPCHLADEDTMAEIKDQRSFVDLLKEMLHLDLNERITPSQLTEDPFITMSDLAESYPTSFYVKSCCEVMEVCRDQSLRSENRVSDVQSVQQPWLNPQASTSSAGLDRHNNVPSQVAPAWHSNQEHPLILRISSAVSSHLSIRECQTPPQPQHPGFFTHKERTSPELHPSCRGNVTPARKMKRDTSETSQSDESPESVPPESKRMEGNTDFIETHTDLLQDSSEASSRTAKDKTVTKRTTVTFIKRKMKRNKRSLCHGQDPCEGPCNTDAVKPTRKRTWETFMAAHSGDRSPDSASPERKRRKMNPGCVQIRKELIQNSNEAATEATPSTARAEPQRKRTWATFKASYIGIRCQDTGSPERKKRKKRKKNPETQTEMLRNSKQFSCSESSESEVDNKTQGCSSPEIKTRRKGAKHGWAEDTQRSPPDA